MRRSGVVLAVGVFIFAGMPAAVWAKTLAVPGQYASIAAAIEASQAGDEIIVVPGTYRENLVLKAGITLRSQGDEQERAKFVSAARTIIQAPKAAKQIVLGANGAVLDGFTIREGEDRSNLQDDDYGIWINGTAMTVANCIVDSLERNGIGIKGPVSGVNLIKNNRIGNNLGSGVVSEEGAATTIEGCEIYQNRASGVLNATGAKVTVRRNVIRQNGVDGVMNTDRVEPLILENEISQNGLNGVGLQLSSRGKVFSNQIKGNRQAGVGLRLNAECEIRGNTISGNSIGVGLMDIKAAVIESNHITANNMIGIGMIACRGGVVTLRNNNLRGNRGMAMSPNMGCELIEEDNEL